MRVEQWTQERAKEELTKRLKLAKSVREAFEPRWQTNHNTIFNPRMNSADVPNPSFTSLSQVINQDLDGSESEISINYVFKYVRFIHAQMSANPPSVIPKPTSTEYNDRRAAEVADNIIQYLRKKLEIQEVCDSISLETLSYGTGVGKVWWNPLIGDLRDYDPETCELTMEGEAVVECVPLANVWFDPEARTNKTIKWAFQKHVMTMEEALFRFPEHKQEIEQNQGNFRPQFWDTTTREQAKDMFEYYEYYEKALPWNGMAGRHCFMTEGGLMLSPVKASPMPGGAMPFFVLTDIDIPHQLYGRTFVDYLIRLQQVLNQLDSTVLDQIQAHGVARLVLFAGAEVEDESLTNGAWDFVKISGSQAPYYINPPQLMPDMHRFRQQLIEGMESIAGVNESMFGQVKRELSGFSLQTAINAGNMVRRRLFNKYTLAVEIMYTRLLEVVQQYYTDKRRIEVVGDEDAIGVAYYQGADIANGYTLSVDYGTSFSLDPASRREEIMQLLPWLEKAGVDLKQVLSLLKLNELNVVYDMFKLAERRQLEVFDEMISLNDGGARDIYIPPQKNELHADMLPFAQRFRMSAKYKYLPLRVKENIDKHIDERAEMLAQQAVPAAPPGPPAGLPGLPGAGAPAPAPLPAMA